jgi:5-methylcytosine-specific restriction endonuclease McrA
VAAYWSEVELVLLRDTSLSLAEVAERTGRSAGACRAKAGSLRVCRYGWLEADLELLRDVSVPLIEVAARTGHPLSSVRGKASALGIQRRPSEWSEAELLLLSDKSLSYAEVAAQTGRSVATVKSRASIIGAARRVYPSSWEAWELELLADPDLSLAEVMRFTGRSWASVQLKASRSQFRRRTQNPMSGTGRSLYGQDWQAIRAEVLERDGFSCQEGGCGLYVPSGKGLHVHHVIPYRLYPVTEPRWLLTLCISHHLSRPEHWWKVLPPYVEALLRPADSKGVSNPEGRVPPVCGRR